MPDHPNLDPALIERWRKSKIAPSWIRIRRQPHITILTYRPPFFVLVARQSIPQLLAVPVAILAVAALRWYSILGYSLPQTMSGKLVFFGLIAAAVLLACLIPKLSRAFSFHRPPQLTPIIVTNEGEFHFEAARRDELIPADKILAVEFITFTYAPDLAALRVLIADDSDESHITPIIACVGSKLTVEHAARIFEGTQIGRAHV